jgi:signal transduction histidine kinase
VIAQLKSGHSNPRLKKCRHQPVDARRTVEGRQTHEVLAQFSHELRNFLGIIRGAMHVLKVGAVENAAHENARVLIGRQLAQMSQLIDDLLDITRMRNGHLQLRRARVDICVVVARAMHAVECVLRQREHHMTVSFPDAPVWLPGDAGRLEQVFINLLLNAAKYTNVGGKICLSVMQQGNEALVTIRDTGVGIAADVLPRVFDLYVQADPSARDGGLGLGLPLVRALVESHGGSVTAASNGVGCGSEFSVHLPAFAQP